MRVLKKAVKLNPDGVIRLSRFLGLRTKNMSLNQVAKLIKWRLSRRDMM